MTQQPRLFEEPAPQPPASGTPCPVSMTRHHTPYTKDGVVRCVLCAEVLEAEALQPLSRCT